MSNPILRALHLGTAAAAIAIVLPLWLLALTVGGALRGLAR